MSRLRANDRLAPQDAIFLYLETEQTPLHIGSVSVFAGSITLAECLNLVESKLPRIPRYRQRIVAPPWNMGHPTWEFDPDFDIHRHVRNLVMKRGTMEELREIAGGIFGQVMDRNRPLWDLTLAEGLEGGRTALIGRVHHCLADGISGAEIMNVILDVRPTALPIPEKKKRFRVPPLPDQVTSLLNALLTSWSETTNQILYAQAETLALGESLLSDDGWKALRDSSPMVSEIFSPVEPLPFNQPCSGPRNVAWTEIPIAEAKAIKAACGSTLNDVVLAVLAFAVRRYVKRHGVVLKKRKLSVMVPVSLRHDEKDLGNRVSLIPVSIPLDIPDPVKLLRAIHRRTEAMKGARVAEFVKLMSTWAGAVPASLQASLSTLALPVPPFNMVCTNVPGPQIPIYLLGHQMLSSYPYVPIGNGMSVNCAVQSYRDTLYFGLTGDAVAAPDLSRLNKFLHTSFLELREAAGVPARASSRAGLVPAEARTEEPPVSQGQPVAQAPPGGVERCVPPRPGKVARRARRATAA